MTEKTNPKTHKELILSSVEKQFGKDACDMWFGPVDFSLKENILYIYIPNQFWRHTIRERYESLIKNTLLEAGETVGDVRYDILEKTPDSLILHETEQDAEPVRAIPAAASLQNRLNNNYTFEGFVEGPSNRFAYKAAEAVVKKLGDRANNPLVIYSSPGLGKTHLLHAIGNQIIREKPGAKVLYMSGEGFVSDFIESLQNKTADSFRKKYRSLDCFLMDDIQFVAGKDASETEFFYTFNALFESRKQIVLTSDKPTQQLSLDERLRSRLLSGIVVEIKKPDFETRMAILRKKRDALMFDIDDDVIAFLAQGVQANIREMEGALFRLISYCNIHSVTPTVAIAKEILADIINIENNKAVAVDTIKKIVSKNFKIHIEDFNSKRKNHSIAWPRQIAMYLCTELTNMSLPEIGREFNRDHSTVVHARDRIKEQIEKDPFFSAQLNGIILDINSMDTGQ